MSALTVITGLMPLLKAAAEVVAAFQGDENAARTDDAFTDAAEIIAAVGPLIDSFTRGMDVTEEDVRASLAGMDQALADFDAEIARQQAGG